MDIKSLHHVCVQTDRYEESLAFYRDVLGFNLVRETPGFHGRAFNSWLDRGGFKIELQTGKSGRTMRAWSEDNIGPVHLAFMVTDVAAEYKSLKNNPAIVFKKNPQGEELYAVNGAFHFKFYAPEGTEIEIRDAD